MGYRRKKSSVLFQARQARRARHARREMLRGRWTGKKNLAIFWRDAKMAMYFCEVPSDAAAESAGSQNSFPSTTTTPEYQTFWLDIVQLKRAIGVDGRPKPVSVGGKPRYFFALSLAPLLNSVRVQTLLGVNSTNYQLSRVYSRRTGDHANITRCGQEK